MKAVNLVPVDARRSRASGRTGPTLTPDALGPAQFLVLFLLIVVAIVLLRVLADNTVNNKKATLAAVNAQVSVEQAQAAKLSVYITFVTASEQKESQVRSIAEQRFPWKRTFDQVSHVLPSSTTLSGLQATTAATASTNSSGEPVTGPTFTLTGCADTPNLNGVATLLRRLTDLKEVTNVGFSGSTHTIGCNSFDVILTFNAPGSTTTTATTGSTTAVPATTTTATTTTPSGTTTG